jgi:TolB-like protein
MHLRGYFFTVLLLFCGFTVFGQIKPRLGILPFTGGIGGDGETIATLFSFQNNIQESFTVVPRTSAVNALVVEQQFQLSGYTDSDTIARIGRLLNADFIVSGNILRLGNSNLVITTIVNVETFELLVGDYREYRSIEEVRSLLPEISNKIIVASKRNSTNLPKLAIAPFSIANEGVDIRVAEALAQILAIEITNTEKYAVLPRTTTLQAALNELDFQMQGYTAEEGAKVLGKAINAQYVLSAEVRSLGSLNMFTAQILNVEDGTLLAGDSRDYRIIDDGIKLMPELALLLTDKTSAASRISALDRERTLSSLFGDTSKFWSLGLSVGTSLNDPWVNGTLHGTIAPLKYSFLELGFEFGFISGIEEVNSYYSLFPFVHYSFYLPFNSSNREKGIKGGWYLGTGGGYVIANYEIDDSLFVNKSFSMDFTTGFLLFDFLDISYTLRTNFEWVSSKISLGYSYRFKK